MTTPLHCKVCAKLLRGQQRLYCGRPCKRRAYLVQRKLREARELADVVDKGIQTSRVWTHTTLTKALTTGSTQEKLEIIKDLGLISTLPTPPQPSLLRRCCAYIQLLAHTLYHIFDGWRTRK